ncbi:MAG: hypothetical protein QOJ58_5570, partial [Alphaproteobacteria bacterium]|nr:hypothetical protein [Alphaproteobacteria bacterium]
MRLLAPRSGNDPNRKSPTGGQVEEYAPIFWLILLSLGATVFVPVLAVYADSCFQFVALLYLRTPMKRRSFVAGLGITAAWQAFALAQSTMATIGFLHARSR